MLSAWSGVLHEFRNHLSDISSVANELQGELPPTLAHRLGDALTETERSLEGLAALLALADASVGERAKICDLGKTLERAVDLAAPAIGHPASLVVERGERTGIKNAGSMLECLLAMLVLDLAQTRVAAPAPPPRVILRAESARGSLSIEIESDGLVPTESSWRLALAHELAGKLGARILPQLEAATYVVQFR